MDNLNEPAIQITKIWFSSLLTVEWDQLKKPHLEEFLVGFRMNIREILTIVGIFIPIFGDQPRNSGMMQFNGLGLVYDKFELHDGKKLASTIREVLENNK